MGRVTLLILATLTLYLSLFFLAVDVRLRCSSLDLFISGHTMSWYPWNKLRSFSFSFYKPVH